MPLPIPSPSSLGLPEKFEAWRPAQIEALRWLLASTKRIKALCAPTGFGKTAVYVAYALITKLPTCFVTDSRALQDQLMEDYAGVGMVDIRGRRNYICDLKDDFTCEEGYASRCPYKGTVECPSSQAEMRAASSFLVVTNYDKWTSARKYGTGMQHFQQVVFDEGHKAPDALNRSVNVQLYSKEINDTLGLDFPSHSQAEEYVNWKPWAVNARAEAEVAQASAKSVMADNATASTVRHFLHMRNLTRRLSTLATANPANWIADEAERGYQFDPIRSGRYAESALLLQVPSILVVSATLRPKTLFMLGVGKTAFDFKEFDSEFDPSRCPIYYIPTMRVDSRAEDLARLWILHDQIAARRTDRKGIVHTVSFARRDEVMQRSRFSPHMLINVKGDAATGMIARFKQSKPGTILVSPSVGEGFDFPGCVIPETKILTANLTHVEAHSLKVGDRLAAFDEHPPTERRSRQWKESIVLSNAVGKKECRRLVFDDDTEITCSVDHPLLRYSGSRSARWKRANKLRPFVDSIVRITDCWQTSEEWWAGYLAGIWDGEGHLSQRLNEWRSGGKMPHISLGMCQVENSVLTKTIRLLIEHNFDIATYRTTRREEHHQDKVQVLISTRRDMLRFLGECRPDRLIAKLQIDMLGSLRPVTPLMIVRNESVGIKEVSLLSTSTKTYISNGLASHNTDCEWQFLCKIPFPNGHSKIHKARQADDPEYGAYLAITKMVQIFGRGMRLKRDRCENFIGDMHLDWFLPRYGHLAPKSFHGFFKRISALPPPPERL